MARSNFISGRAVCAVGVLVLFTSMASADEFGSSDSAFTMEFATISAETGPAQGEVGYVAEEFSIGVYEVTQQQWSKYQAALGETVPGSAKPVNGVTWYEAAAFVNWLNTDRGKQIAYDLTDELDAVTDWEVDGQSCLRHPDAFYFLPNENEWIKAGYWNGSEVQMYANRTADALEDGKPKIGDGTGEGWNYSNFTGDGVWDVGSGSQELNDTYDMMGNVYEWTQAHRPWNAGEERPVVAGGSVYGPLSDLRSDKFGDTLWSPSNSGGTTGFRVASVPEPCSLALMALGGAALLRRRRG